MERPGRYPKELKNLYIYILHVFYWLLYALLIGILYLFLNLTSPVAEIGLWCRLSFGFAVVPGLLSFYCFYLFVFYRFRQRNGGSTGYAIAGILFAAAIGAMTGQALIGKIFMFNDGYRSFLAVGILLMLVALVNGVAGLMLKGFIAWYNDIELNARMRQKQHEHELALVKLQLDPHFLFNTINNIDVLIEEAPQKASAYLNKLSEMMRFMLYETKGDKILLSDEFAYIEKYAELQKIRSFNSAYISLQLTGDAGGLMIAPMLLIPFIENAFKHNNDRETPGAITIRVDVQGRKLIFYCSNYYDMASASPGGIGLSLIRQRLQLVYPGHDMLVDNDNGIFRVTLILDL